VFRLDTYAIASISDSESSPDTVELRCIAPAEGSSGLHWTMSRDDANDLARWWSTEDIRVKSGQRPIRDKECGNVLVSMFTSSMIHVRVRDRFGNIKVAGYSFPRAVLEHLGRWSSEQRLDSQALNRPRDT
jgi:hypothetical protein